MKRQLKSEKGFTLVEIMVAIAILGLVVMAISSSFISQQREGLTQEDVAEAQQSARIGLETMVKDIRRAGIMVKPSVAYPVENAGNFGITITLGSEMDGYAAIVNPADADGNITGLASPITFTVDTARDFQNRLGSNVKVIRPSAGTEAGRDDGANNVCYSVTAVNTASSTITLTYVSGALPTNGVPGITFKPGDTIILSNCAFTWPVRIRYYLEPDPAATPGTSVKRNLMRHLDADADGAIDVGETTEVIASNIIVPDANADGTPDDRDGNGLSDVLFRYLDANGNETADKANITSVSIDLTAATGKNVAQLSGQNRTRELTSLIRLKNRKTS